MKTRLKYFAILGCVSSGLMSAAYANNTLSDDKVEFVFKPDFSNIVCNGEKRHAHFVIKNKNDDEVRINNISIKINEDDSYPHNRKVVKLDDHHEESYEGHRPCERWDRLQPRQSCVITVEVNPHELECNHDTLLMEGEIERTLFVSLMNNDQRSIQAPIDFDVNTLGVAGEFALLGSSITNHHAGAANVSQNIAYTDRRGHITDNIILNDGAQAYGPYDEITRYAVSDLETSYHGLKHLTCTPIDHDLGNYETIPSGTYCFDGSAPVVVKNLIRFSGSKPHVFIVDFHDTDEDDLTFDVQKSARFKLENGASADSIYWVIDGSVRMHPKSQFAGTIMANGSFASEGEGAGALVDGRILLVKDRYEVLDVNAPKLGEIALHGNFIQNPESAKDLAD